MNAYSDKRYVELFHLLFLAHLGTKVDKRVYALKGGCNLRFFFRSPRYSEDMDLDVKGISVDKLGEKVNGILKSKPFSQILQANGIAIAHINDDKQTPTTQRWKLGLTVPQIERPVPTKIEFSRRGLGENVDFDAIDPLIIGQHQIQPFMTSHYPKDIAYQQKVSALIGRAETQARDIFDLHLLLSSGAKVDNLPKRLKDRLEEARQNVMAIDFDAFKGQVLAYLLPDQQAAYDHGVWDSMRLFVIEIFEKVKNEAH